MALSARRGISLIAALLAACQAVPGLGPAATPAAPLPVAAPLPESVPPPAPLSDAQLRQALDAARNHLDQGEPDAAAAELRRILAGDPQQRTANTLMRQIREDPEALYGRASFAYKVASGDTLATIAQRLLNDRDQFYGLARYNGMAVPRQLPVGQTIRIPGTRPARMPPAVREPAAAAREPAPPVLPGREPAAAPAPPREPAPPPVDPAAAVAAAARQKKAESERHTRAARAAMARQDLCAALRSWEQVLQLDPDNRTALLEREKALELKRRLPNAKC